MISDSFYMLTFNSTHHAIKIERLLSNSGIKAEVMPTPREISASCGLSIRVAEDALDMVKRTVKLEDSTVSLYRCVKKNNRTTYFRENEVQGGMHDGLAD